MLKARKSLLVWKCHKRKAFRGYLQLSDCERVKEWEKSEVEPGGVLLCSWSVQGAASVQLVPCAVCFPGSTAALTELP